MKLIECNMKYLIILALFLVLGCKYHKQDNNNHYTVSSTMVNYPIIVDYNGHSYIVFNQSSSSEWGVHDPDCKCNKKEDQ
jgi:hypothetical protein